MITPMTEPFIVRLNGDGSLDEICARGCNFHLEQMDTGYWWMGIEDPVTGEFLHVNLQARGKIRAWVERENHGSQEQQAPDGWWSSVIKRAFEQGVSEAFIAWQDLQARERTIREWVPKMHALMNELEATRKERDAALAHREKWQRLADEAAQYVEWTIITRTGFTGEPPYVGWKGLGLALKEALDELDKLRVKG